MNRRRVTIVTSILSLAAVALIAGGCSSTSNSTAGAEFNHAKLAGYGTGQQQVIWTRRAPVPAAAFGMASGDMVAMKSGQVAMANLVRLRQTPANPIAPTLQLPETAITTVPTSND
jgi:phosphodiesterase/alkaline phosphatase D-like protein